MLEKGVDVLLPCEPAKHITFIRSGFTGGRVRKAS